ncbi:hypothetical protein K0T92_16240 [Paenibacillus oenotherae]|uniref:Uncharacterized protein n=2 Tax=Paenibacillus oenotherae TaxID=1435645 RepID=A0ABS7D8M3_9BACL|nr:hypothetical protein [Paenibacillus oenotherae]
MHFNRKPIDLKTIGQLVAQGVGRMLNREGGARQHGRLLADVLKHRQRNGVD